MKKLLPLFLFFITFSLYSQENPTVIPQKDPNTDILSLSSSNNSASQPSKRDATEINKDNLIQYYKDQMAPKTQDPYPLASYTGSFMKDIKKIQEQFQVKNIKMIKASLENWLQTDATTFPDEGYLMLGNIYDYLQLYDKAIQTYDAALKVVPEEEKIAFLLNKSQVLRHFSKNKEAIDLLSKIDPKYQKQFPQIFLYSGISSLYLDDRNGAILNLRKYLEYVPKGTQSDKVRRAIAWLIYSKNGSGGGSGGNGEADQRAQMEKALQNLVDSQLDSEENNLDAGAHAGVDDNSLNIKQKSIDEGDNSYNAIAD